MRKNLFIVAIATLVVCSCGTTKNSIGGRSTLGQEIQKSPAQLKAEDPNATTLRAYASYNAFESMNPARNATASARAALAESVASLVESGITHYAEQYGQESLSDGEIQKQMSANNNAKNELKQVAKELVTYAPVIETNQYEQADGTIIAHVCVELHPSKILESVRESKSYQEAVNKDQQNYIDFKSEQFGKSLQSAFEELKQAKNE